MRRWRRPRTASSQHRLDGVKLAAGAFTNLTQDHLDYHPDFDDYRRAKMRLFSELLPKGAPAVINADSPEREAFEAAAKAAGLKPFTVGWRGDRSAHRRGAAARHGQDLNDPVDDGARCEGEKHESTCR